MIEQHRINAYSLAVTVSLFGSLCDEVEGANLLLNGDFEGNNLGNSVVAQTTDPANWTVTSGETDLVNNALGVVGSNGPTWLEIGGLTANQTVFEQSLAIAATGMYEWGFDYSSWSGGGQFAVTFSLIDASDSSIIDSTTVTPSSGNGVWQQYNDSGTLDSGKTYIFRFVDSGGVGNQGAILDNAVVSLVPEPSAITLLGFGWLSLLFRRSRN